MPRDNDVRRPMADWDESAEASANVVWWSRLDGHYQIEVQRVDDYRGELCVFDHDQDDRLIVHEPVTLSYGAVFGPDVSDVDVWQERAIHLVDGRRGEDQEI